MRMRFWATIRKPAFSISALTAPVRLRSVASGLMIEKVRSIAIELRPYKTLGGSCRAYIGAIWRRQATRCRVIARLDGICRIRGIPAAAMDSGLEASSAPNDDWEPDYDDFTKVNPFCNCYRACVQLHRPRLAS